MLGRKPCGGSALAISDGLAWNSIGVLFAFILDAMVPPSIGKDRPEGDDDDDCDDCDDDDM